MRRTIPMGSGSGNRPREQQSEQTQAAKPIPTRWQKRRLARNVAANERRLARTRSRRRVSGVHGRAAVQRWAIDHWVQLQQLNGKLRPGTELETRADRKKLVIARNHELARRIGCTNAQLANLTSQERAFAVAAKTDGGFVPGQLYRSLLRKGIEL